MRSSGWPAIAAALFHWLVDPFTWYSLCPSDPDSDSPYVFVAAPVSSCVMSGFLSGLPPKRPDLAAQSPSAFELDSMSEGTLRSPASDVPIPGEPKKMTAASTPVACCRASPVVREPYECPSAVRSGRLHVVESLPGLDPDDLVVRVHLAQCGERVPHLDRLLHVREDAEELGSVTP